MFLPGDAYYYGDPHNIFDDNALRWFNAEEANYPTRVYCKALALELLIGGRLHRSLVERMTLDALAHELGFYPGRFLGYTLGVSAFKCLHEWAKKNGLASELDNQKGDNWWYWVLNRMDMTWIAARLKKELANHGHRANARALELISGGYFEHQEAKLQPFEELLLPALQDMLELPDRKNENG